MKHSTFSADERLIEAARERARSRNRTLDDEFREWLEQYVAREGRVRRAMDVIARIREHADSSGPKPTREELNERPKAGRVEPNGR